MDQHGGGRPNPIFFNIFFAAAPRGQHEFIFVLLFWGIHLTGIREYITLIIYISPTTPGERTRSPI